MYAADILKDIAIAVVNRVESGRLRLQVARLRAIRQILRQTREQCRRVVAYRRTVHRARGPWNVAIAPGRASTRLFFLVQPRCYSCRRWLSGQRAHFVWLSATAAERAAETPRLADDQVL